MAYALTNKNMETPGNLIEVLFEKAETFGKTTLELTKLKALNTTTLVVTALVSKLSVVVMVSICLLPLNIGIALFLGEILGKMYYGFFIVAAFYFIVAIVFYFFLYNWIKKPIFNTIIRQALK
jgi:hypothetical protein